VKHLGMVEVWVFRDMIALRILEIGFLSDCQRDLVAGMIAGLDLIVGMIAGLDLVVGMIAGLDLVVGMVAGLS